MWLTLNKRLLQSLVLTIGALCLAGAVANEPTQEELKVDPAEIIAYKGNVMLTQDEIDAAFSKVPEKDRLRFIRDGGRVDQLIKSLLQRKVIASEARKAGFDREPMTVERMSLAAQKELAEAWLQHLLEDAPPADYEALAYEDYLANPDAYRSEEIVDVSHILIGTETRTAEEAEQLANVLKAKIDEDPSSFDALVIEYSDDPAKSVNDGRYPEMRRGQMVVSFERSAFAMEHSGQISKPVKTDYGYHIIRLNGRHGNNVPEYAEVKSAAMERVKQAYLESYRQNYLRNVLKDPIVTPDGAVEIMARRHFGENLEFAPVYQE